MSDRIQPDRALGEQVSKVFDYFLTLPSEVTWVWSMRWNMTRIIFTVSRYFAFVAGSLTAYITIVAAEVLIIIRVYAFWERNRRLLLILLAYGVADLFQFIYLIAFETVLLVLMTLRKYLTYRRVKSRFIELVYTQSALYTFFAVVGSVFNVICIGAAVNIVSRHLFSEADKSQAAYSNLGDK
ncbi:hypothetical protein CONPUDRAFT_68605 [Coniophora puteana RWD-64-598 SS2]|uniref:DUF6533 domain-containing protein n=1 Tax=Coniophora puteana (strain RWD-64-598) TaxID=741705 RepID=A0A5M3N3H2_CONPW|nr:uncharacterized protein CONPUDRAFT_68605 [Coniophora puteana RWD-64-598 SS2]EIW85969.1 hypothetical protein CONPUDRAFT_68605 [Coniophora puteana RWD-64-598 SS2]